MAQPVRITQLPEAPLDAAAAFHREHLARAREALSLEDAAVLLFDPAGHEHDAWRLAAVRELAREAAPKRVNAIAGSDTAAIEQAMAYLEAAHGVTGQLLAVDGKTGQNR